MKHSYVFPHILLAPDDNGGNGDASSASQDDATQQQQQDPSGVQQPDAFDAAATAAIEAVQSSAIAREAASPTAGQQDDSDKTKDKEQGDSLGKRITDEDGKAKPSEQGTDKQQTQEEKDAAAAQALKDGDKDKGKATEPDDSKLPFNNHPRWKEVLAERDTAKTEVARLETEWKPIVESQKSITDYCAANNITPSAFQETLQFRALMNTDPAKALEQLMPIVQSLQALTGKGINDPVLLQKVKDGLMDEDSAREITKLRAEQAFKQTNAQTQQQQVAQQNLRQMEQSVTTWFNSKKSLDPAFEDKVVFVNGLFGQMVNATPPKTSADVTALLEKALIEVNTKLTRFNPPVKPRKAPLGSSHARPVPAEPETLDEYADQLIEKSMSGQ